MAAMLLQDRKLDRGIRVAAVFDLDRLRPVWFEIADDPGAGRVFVKSVNYRWEHSNGAGRQFSSAVSASDGRQYTLVLDTRDLSWSLLVAETTPV